MAFKFGQRQVADAAAQQNFEQLEGLFPVVAGMSKLDVVSAGPIAGNGAGVATGAAASELVGLGYTTPDVPMQGLVYAAGRFDTAAASWVWAQTRIDEVLGGDSSKIGPSAGVWDSLLWLHGAGQASADLKALNLFKLNTPRTAYQFNLRAVCSTSVTWSTEPRTYMFGVFWAQ